jgi:arylsulfatase
VTYREGAIGIPESALPNTFNRSWSVAAQVSAETGAQGVIAAVGGMSAGWSLYLDPKGCPTFAYRLFSMDQLLLKCDKPLTTGDHAIRLTADYEGPGSGGAARLRLIVNDKLVAERRVTRTAKSLYTIDETFDVGIDRGSPVGTYPMDGGIGFPFISGAIEGVTISAQ